MTGVRRIVAGTDFSPDADRALARAAALAAQHHAALELLHVVDAGQLDAVKSIFSDEPGVEQKLYVATQRALDDAASRLAPDGVRVRTALRVGAVVADLLTACRDADLLVVGAHGSNSLRDRILGTTAARLIGRSRVPVAVVRGEAPGEYRRVLVAVDLSACSVAAIDAAARIAPAAGMQLLHAYDVPFEGKLWLAGVPNDAIDRHRDDVRIRAVRDLEALAARLTPPTAPELTLARGEPALSILEAAARQRPDLIVLGRQGRSAVSEILLGSVTRHVLADADCDVLIVPAGNG